jgi:hypothetical protein
MPDALLTFIYISSSDGLSVSCMTGSYEAKFDGKDHPVKDGPNLAEAGTEVALLIQVDSKGSLAGLSEAAGGIQAD